VKRRAWLLIPVSLLVAAGLVTALAIWGWPGAGRASGEFPEFVYYSPEAERGYRLAVQHPRLFAQVACYCGCVNLPKEPHRNLRDCFLNDDASFDPHAAGCTVCADIANDSVAWQEEGKSAREVASLVDEKYESVGPPTVQ